MALHLYSGSGCVILLAILFVSAAVVAYFLHEPKWLVIIPVGVVILGLILAVLPIKKKITPQQWAQQLEPHLLGTDGPWDWDDAISVRLADSNMDALRIKMARFDSLNTEERRREFENIIAALKRGEIPETNGDWR